MRPSRGRLGASPGAAALALSAATLFVWPADTRAQLGSQPARSGERPPTAIRPASGQVVGVWLELSQRGAATSLGSEGEYRYQVTALTVHPRVELRLDRAGVGPAGSDWGAPAARPQLFSRPPEAGFWKGFVWMPVHFIDRLERWEQSDGPLEVRRSEVRMGPGRAGLTFFHPFPDNGTAIEFTAAALLAPPYAGSPGRLGVAVGVSVSVVRDPVLAGAGWEGILEGASGQRADHRLSGYWRYFANESVVLTLGASIRVSAADWRMTGHMRSSFAWLVRDGLQWELAVSQPLGGDGPFSFEVGVVTGELQ